MIRVQFYIITLFCLSILFPNKNISRVEAFPNLIFTRPVDLQSPHDGSDRIFVVEQEGLISVFPNDSTISSKSIFLDVRNIVYDSSNEMGLLGLAFHPDYKDNGFFYINYTSSNPRKTIIARYQVNSNNPNVANSLSQSIIIEINQPYSNHNGGGIQFGPDGYLYIGLGDGGSAGDPLNHGQNLNSLLGSMLRIDVDNSLGSQNYLIPVDNPFGDEIYAYGLRNPWRFSFDNLTGDLWAADVGQYEIEEIDIIKKGKNYGWKTMEGNECYSPSTNCNTNNLELPIWEYNHNAGACSVTGGYVYRGSKVPDLYGRYIYGDFCNGQVWSLSFDFNPVINEELGNYESSFPSSFGEDESHELYMLSFSTGKIYKFYQEGVLVLGDINFDGMVNVLDIIQSVNFVLGQTTPTAQQQQVADVNADGVLNVLDVVGLVNIIIGNK